MTKCAAIQMISGANVEKNLAEAEQLISDAVRSGSKLVVLPENFAFMGMHEYDKLSLMEVEGRGPIQDFLSKTSKHYAVWIVAGTIPLQSEGSGKCRAATLVFNEYGERVDRYDKIHLFDVDVPDSDERYRESDTIDAGEEIRVIDSPIGRLGLAVCYDLRFPELFRAMLAAGMEAFVLPSAFTEATGAAHWKPLLRARAIENLCYVIAPNQGGLHENMRKTFGNSMIIDPWGRILNTLGTGSGVVSAEIDLQQLRSVRESFPVLQNRRINQE